MGSSHVADTLARSIDAILPQTQCTQCGYTGCLPYARAIATDDAPINRCPPGGSTVIKALAKLVERPEVPLDPACGATTALQVARIDESLCIGCTFCIRACPVDAIIGAPKKMHVVIDALCTGCNLCVAPCPVDCITLIPAADRAWTRERADRARKRHNQVLRRRAERTRLLAGKREEAGAIPPDATSDRDTRASTRRTNLIAAVARARAKRAARHGAHS
ncbi:MAG: RnfABCDGE type electron transport complex subunit B [Burkholderiales bacterium]